MQTAQSAGSSPYRDLRWLLVTFPLPAGRHISVCPLDDSFWIEGFVEVDGTRLFPEESPLLVQPDLLVDLDSGLAIGLAFDVESPDDLRRHWAESLSQFDPRAIRVITELGVNRDVNEVVEMFWSTPTTYERMFAGFDFGLWALLYDDRMSHEKGRNPLSLAPNGFLVADVGGLGRLPLVRENDFSQIGVRVRRGQKRE